MAPEEATVNSNLVSLRNMKDAPVVEVDDDVDAAGALVVNCFPSVGFVSSIVAHYLIDKLELRLVGGVNHSKLPPMCLVQDGKPLPPLRFYTGEPICKLDKCDKIILIISEVKIENQIKMSLARSLIDWTKESKAGVSIMIDSFTKGDSEGHTILDDDDIDTTMLGIGSTDSAIKMLKEIGLPLLKHGLVGGMTGVMLGESRRRGIDSLAILAESNGGPMKGQPFPDARAAARIIECLDGLLPTIHLDPGPLLEEAKRIENQIRDMMAVNLNSSIDDHNGPESMFG
ncbi:MAG: PAC2 family protein [Candidatus Thalassarchaeaceae archaeon]|nr:PAC2 family protein [Candidatus Thalassarchaeaceae archaeon]